MHNVPLIWLMLMSHKVFIPASNWDEHSPYSYLF